MEDSLSLRFNRPMLNLHSHADCHRQGLKGLVATNKICWQHAAVFVLAGGLPGVNIHPACTSSGGMMHVADSRKHQDCWRASHLVRYRHTDMYVAVDEKVTIKE